MITYKTKEEIQVIRDGGKRLAAVLDMVVDAVKPGATTKDLEDIAVREIKKAGGEPSFKGYKNLPDEIPFPTALCTSLNEVIVHGPAIPPKIMKKGDIIGIDVGMCWPIGKKNIAPLYTDMARTVPVGTVSPKLQKLLTVTQEALMQGIKAAKIGASIGDISRAIENAIKHHGYGIVRDLVGHGVGYEVHEEPRVPNFVDKNYADIPLKKGMVLAIEPMVTLGKHMIKVLEDNWTIITADKSIAAHFEHTITVGKKGGEILTK